MAEVISSPVNASAADSASASIPSSVSPVMSGAEGGFSPAVIALAVRDTHKQIARNRNRLAGHRHGATETERDSEGFQV